jgi:hypothetical protein
MFKPFAMIVLMASVLSVAIPTAAQAATSSTTVTPPPPVVPPPPPKPVWRGPLAPPAITDVSRAYEFRTQINGNPQCQRFATEADNVFLNGQLDDEQKVAKLKAIGEEAKASNCLN